MKQKTAIIGLSMISLAALAPSCSEEAGGFGSGEGRIMPTVNIDTEAVTSRAMSRAEVTDVTKDDLSLRIAKKDGSFQKTWDKLADFDTKQTFSVGEYTVEAFYGDPSNEGFEKPAFAGSQAISVADGQTTQVALTATPANAMFTLDYSEAFKNYMQAYSAEYVTATNTIAVPADETRPVYVAPGQVTLNVEATTPASTKANFKVATVTAEAGYNYMVHVDVNGGETGSATLVVTFDESLATETVEIDLSEELLSAPAPALTANGFDPASQIEFIAGFGTDAKPTMNIIAMAGLKSVTMRTESASLIAKGWPAEVELLNNRDAKVVELGLSAIGLWKQPDKMAVIDFSGVLANIAANADNPVSTFSVTVTDALNRVSDPLTLTVRAESPNLVLNKLDNYVPGENLRVSLEFNGTAQQVRDLVKFSYVHAASGMQRNLEIVDIEAASRAMNSYIVTITTPTLDEALALTASCGGVSSKCTVDQANFKIAGNDNDTYATHAYVTVAGTDGTTPDLSAAKFLVKGPDDADYREVKATNKGSYFVIEGLTPGAANRVKVAIGDDVCRPITLNAEADAQIPNGNLDADVTYDGSESHWENVVFQGWGTNNKMTTSQGSNYGYCRVSGTIQTDDSHSGKAALIRNVGWGSGNTAVSDKAVGSGLLGKGICKYTDAGLLHLGSTRTTRPSGYSGDENKTNDTSAGPITTTDLDCGIAFNSRPSSLSFWYKYSPKNSSDKGLAEILISNDNGTIASQTIYLDASASYQQKNITLDYPFGTSKATKIYVKFISSYDMEYLKRTNDNFSGPGRANLSRGTYMGSQLYIDDIELIY
ncbi:MAG: DUF4493 domain-containing protein [Muribaculaceae bacterium]